MLGTKIEAWLRAITDAGSLPDGCAAIYIGLFEGEAEYTLHFLGSIEFEREDDDWACEADGDYMPERRYLASGVSTDADCESFLTDVVAAIREVRSSGDTILSQTSNVAVGFDSGELEYI